MDALIQTIAPICAIILAGYLCGHTKLISHEGSKSINSFVYYFALPMLFITFLSETQFSDIVNIGAVIAFFGAQLFIIAFMSAVAIILFSKHNLPQVFVQSMAGMFSNTGYLGIPLMITAFGYANANIAITTTIINGAITLPLIICLLSISRTIMAGSQPQIVLYRIIKNVLYSLLTNPLFLSACVGLFMAYYGIKASGAIKTFLDISSQAASPAALFAIGLFLAWQSRSNIFLPQANKKFTLIETFYVSLVKIVIHPLLAWVLSVHFLHLPPLVTAGVVIMSALPSGGLVFIVAEQNKLYERQSAAIILLSTLFSVVTLSFLLTHYESVFAF